MNSEEIPDFDSALEFRMTLNPETDRGCALMAAAYLDDRLGELLKAYFVDNAKVADDLLGQSQPLGTFSSRIDTAYALGLISEEEHRCLHLIRKIRNDFGHVAQPISFDDPGISDRCKHLEGLSFVKRSNHRAMFTGAVMSVLARINFGINTVKHLTAVKDVNPSKVSIKGPSKEQSARVVRAMRSYAGLTPQNADEALLELESALSEFMGACFREHVSISDREAIARKMAAHFVKQYT